MVADAAFFESHDGEPFKNVTAQRIAQMHANVDRDRKLLDQIDNALGVSDT